MYKDVQSISYVALRSSKFLGRIKARRVGSTLKFLIQKIIQKVGALGAESLKSFPCSKYAEYTGEMAEFSYHLGKVVCF